MGWEPWTFDPFGAQEYDVQVDDPALMQECVDARWPCANTTVSMVESGCFNQYYRHNLERRAAVASCFTQTCFYLSDCICAEQPEGQPWLGQPAPDPDPWACPWRAQ
jgi:hypothetical protein